MLRAAIGFSVVLMCAQGVSALSTTERNVTGATTDTYNATEAVIATYPVIIKINNVNDLNMIGKNPSYPTDGHYELTGSFDASGFEEPIEYFNGSINGNCHTIHKIKNCLVENLAGDGVIHHLAFNDANTTNAKCASAVVGTAKDNAAIRFIRVESGLFQSNEFNTDLGSVAKVLIDSARIENIVVVNAKILFNGACGETYDNQVMGRTCGYA